MQGEDEDTLLRSAALQNVQSILQARQRAEQELFKTKEALEEETRILELLNKTGATLASNLELRSVVQAVTDAATELTGAQVGGFFYSNKSAGADVFSPFPSRARREKRSRSSVIRAKPSSSLRPFAVKRCSASMTSPGTTRTATCLSAATSGSP